MSSTFFNLFLSVPSPEALTQIFPLFCTLLSQKAYLLYHESVGLSTSFQEFSVFNNLLFLLTFILLKSKKAPLSQCLLAYKLSFIIPIAIITVFYSAGLSVNSSTFTSTTFISPCSALSSSPSLWNFNSSDFAEPSADLTVIVSSSASQLNF